MSVLWALFALCGLVLFGAFPATVALYVVARKWVVEGDSTGVFRAFYVTARQQFLRANMGGYVLLVFVTVLYLDFLVLSSQGGTFSITLSFVLSIGFWLSAVGTLTALPLYARSRSRPIALLKRVTAFLLTRPLSSLAMFAVGIAAWWIFLYFPVLLFLGGIGGLACVQTLIAMTGSERKQRDPKLAQTARPRHIQGH